MTRRMKSRVRVVHDGGMRSERGNSVHGWRVLIECALASAVALSPVGFGRCEGEAFGPFEVIGAELGR